MVGAQGYCEAEGQLAAQDRLQRDTNDKKNELESYIYSLRGKLADALSAYAPDSIKEALSSRLTELEARSLASPPCISGAPAFVRLTIVACRPLLVGSYQGVDASAALLQSFEWLQNLTFSFHVANI